MRKLVWGKDPVEARFLFAQLESHRDDIEAVFGGPLDWRSSETQRSAAIRWDNPVPGGRNSDPDQIKAAGASLAEATARLASATVPHVRTLTPYSDASDAASAMSAPSSDKFVWKDGDVTMHPPTPLDDAATESNATEA